MLNTCKSYLEDLENCLSTTLGELDPIKTSSEAIENSKPFKYCCVFKSSNNNVISREDVFKLVGNYFQSKNKNNKVDFDNPDYVILINVICNLCYISFVDRFFEFRKYNLIEMGAKFSKMEKTSSNTQDKGIQIENNDSKNE